VRKGVGGGRGIWVSGSARRTRWTCETPPSLPASLPPSLVPYRDTSFPSLSVYLREICCPTGKPKTCLEVGRPKRKRRVLWVRSSRSMSCGRGGREGGREGGV